MNVSANVKSNPQPQDNSMSWKQPEPPKQKQETLTSHSFWGTSPSIASVDSTNKNQINKVVSFDNFFSETTSKAPEKPKPQTTQNDMYDFFFPAS